MYRLITMGINKVKKISYPILLALLLVLPHFVPEGWISIIIEMFVLAIAATGANLMTGYSGMVSFGVAGFYGAGAYITALLITKAGVPFEISFFAGPVGTAILSLPLGWFCVRRSAVYFSMLSLAFAQLMHLIVFTWYSFTGGDDGIVGIPMPALLDSTFSYYYFALAVMITCLALIWILINSPFGKAIQALRDNPERAGFVGIDVRKYQLAVFVVSNFFLAAAGSLYCGFNKNVFAEYIHWVKTFEITAVYLLGGIFSFLGPTVGAAIYIFLNKIIIRYTEYWPITLGATIVLITLFMPDGVVGFISKKISGRG